MNINEAFEAAEDASPLTICSCGRLYFIIPADAKHHSNGDEFDGYYWNCTCKSTLFVPEAK